MKSLRALRDDMRDQGGDLLVIDCLPQDAFPKILGYFRDLGLAAPSMVSWNRDYEPFARKRDEEVSKLLEKFKIECVTSRDHLVFEPQEVLKSDKPDDFYRIYSAFARRWFERLSTEEGMSRIKSQEKVLSYFKKIERKPDLFRIRWNDVFGNGDFPFADTLDEFESINNKKVTVPIPEGGFFAAFAEVQKFRRRINEYKEKRDFPSIAATSRISMYLKNGSITVPQIIHSLKLEKSDWTEKTGPAHFLKELVWREFYYSILFHCPQVETKSFLSQYEDIRWENNVDWFEKWKQGKTGFPIVDAGMRELATTGWMHNRVRMIVASFLTKDLLIDWKWGENYFMKELLDGDLAPNNGGWQWAASTGCDPQPYFRIFNPWLQGAKFDAEGVYIKKFVPELQGASPALLHKPDGDRSVFGYPHPIVDHSEQRVKALRLYKK